MRGQFKGFYWETTRNRYHEYFTDSGKTYDFIVWHPDDNRWKYRDSWSYRKGQYESTETGFTMNRMKDYARYIIDRFVKKDYEKSMENRS